MEKSCWSCGHWLIGLGCCVSGINDYKETQQDDSCGKWCPEGTKDTVTDFGDEEGDGTTWEENEFLKDDMSNL